MRFQLICISNEEGERDKRRGSRATGGGNKIKTAEWEQTELPFSVPVTFILPVWRQSLIDALTWDGGGKKWEPH